jgi:glutathione synthase
MVTALFVMDPLDDLSLKKDSTLAMIRAAQRRGWHISYAQQGDLMWRDNAPWALHAPLRLRDAFAADLDPDQAGEAWYELGDPAPVRLGDFDVIFLRKDPPFDMEYVYTTYLLERAEIDGTLVINRPQSVRDCNEKLFATLFTDCVPPLIVTRQAGLIRAFREEHGDIVIKPLDGMGGESVFRVMAGDPNLSVIIETLTDHGGRQVMAQRFIPEIVDGDKRILLVDGEAIPYALARVPMAGEARGNLAAGGTGVGRELTDRDRWIAEQVGPELVSRGLYFVGIDVIGDYLTEVNVTCPTCIRELDAQFDLDIAGALLERVDRELAERGAV